MTLSQLVMMYAVTSNGTINMNDELKRFWKEECLVYFSVLYKRVRLEALEKVSIRIIGLRIENSIRDCSETKIESWTLAPVLGPFRNDKWTNLFRYVCNNNGRGRIK